MWHGWRLTVFWTRLRERNNILKENASHPIIQPIELYTNCIRTLCFVEYITQTLREKEWERETHTETNWVERLMKYTRGRAFWNRLSHDESVYCACKVLFLTFITMDITSTKFYSFHSNEIGELVSCNFGFSISLSVISLKLPHKKNYRLRMTDAVPNKKVKDDEPEDPVESMLQKTGCIDLHYKVQVNSSGFHVIKDIFRQKLDFLPKKIDFLLIFFSFKECIAETQDWRKCRDVVTEFRQCMSSYMAEQQKKYSNSK